MHFIICSTFRVFLSIFLISSNLQLIIPKLYLNTGTAEAPIAVILFLAFNSIFSIILNLLVYSLFNFCFMCWYCVPSLYLIPGHFMFFSVWALVFLCWSQVLNFVNGLIFLFWVQSLHNCQVQVPCGYHHWHFELLASVFAVFPLFYLSASKQPCTLNVILLFLWCVLHILYSTCSTVL